MTSEQHCLYIGDLMKSKFLEPLLKTPVEGITCSRKNRVNG